jgi:hypothetical protein
VWQTATGSTIDDELLHWPPDLFALTDVILERSQAFRFVMSPPSGVSWPPVQSPAWSDAVVAAGRDWSACIDEGTGVFPELLVQEWAYLNDGAAVPLAHLTEAHDWRMCKAALTLHAIADEACAGLGVALDASGGEGLVYRARGRELLARTGSLARLPTHHVRVLPKVRTPSTGSSIRSLSRYVCVHWPGIDVAWHKVPSRRPGSEPHDKGVNYLLLPWPMRVRESDFRPLVDSVGGPADERYGFFEFAPSERLDLDLVDRMLWAARDEVENVNVVLLPESAVEDSEIDDLEALLGRHDVMGLITGVRQRSSPPDRFPGNWVHIAVYDGEHWVRIRQSKHHRWSLDEGQIYQYHLGGALHPHIRWWEAMEVPRRAIQFVEVGEGATFVALVCEDLAQNDEVAAVLRSVGPMVVVTPLLDGPQLSSRWAARYASVLADDPGSAVLTLTSFGMAQRSRPRGQDSSPVVALWKDPGRGIRQIPLEQGAQGILMSVGVDRATRRTSDGRRPVSNSSEVFNMSVFQVRPAIAGSRLVASDAGLPSRSALDSRDLTVLMSWAEAVADALAFAPERLDALPRAALAGAPWRSLLGIPEPSLELDRAIASLFEAVRSAVATGGETPDALLPEVRKAESAEPGLSQLIHRVLRSALEQLDARHLNLERSARW